MVTSRLAQSARAAARRMLLKTQKIFSTYNASNCGADRGTQLALSMAWASRPDLALRDVEFRNTSQNGEDGILLYLFTLAEHGRRRAVELCAGDGIQNNTANLVLHHDWDALMVDGDADLIAKGKLFFAGHAETDRVPPTLAAEWITTNNVNEIIARYGYHNEVDLLSLDMDGVDYWILEAIQLTPRVIVLEYNNKIPPNLAITVPYAPNFTAAGGALKGNGFFGASLGAFDKLLKDRGYRLVGANRHNTNAFFLRNDVLPGRAACTVESCLTSRWALHQLALWPQVSDLGWVNV